MDLSGTVGGCVQREPCIELKVTLRTCVGQSRGPVGSRVFGSRVESGWGSSLSPRLLRKRGPDHPRRASGHPPSYRECHPREWSSPRRSCVRLDHCWRRTPQRPSSRSPSSGLNPGLARLQRQLPGAHADSRYLRSMERSASCALRGRCGLDRVSPHIFAIPFCFFSDLLDRLRIRWLLLAAEAFGITIHSLSISVRRLAGTNPETERSYFQDLHDVKNEAQFWTLLAKARALQVCCNNCKELVQQLIPEFAFVDVAKVQLERRRRDAISWFERRWGDSR